MRKHALALALMAALSTTDANALGLGNITVNSKLNQPLDARIRLTSVPSTELVDIKIDLASPEAFRRAGLERPYVLSTIQFRIDRATGVIKVQTSEPVKEPFLNFLLEVNWRNGRILREYTVLLDPPLYKVEAPPMPVQAPRISVSGAGQPPGKAIKTATRISPPSGGADDGSYVIRKNDTLWEIAARYRPDESVSIHQMMLALFEANREAFIRGNMNLIKTGQTLSIPERATITAMSQSEALQVYQKQQASWQAYRQEAGQQPAAAPRTAMAAPSGAAPKPSLAEPSFKISGLQQPGKPGEKASGASAGAGAGQSDLLALQEQIARLQQEKEKLESDLNSTNQLLVDMRSAMAVQNDMLANLQKQMEEQRKQEGGVQQAQTPAQAQTPDKQISSGAAAPSVVTFPSGTETTPSTPGEAAPTPTAAEPVMPVASGQASTSPPTAEGAPADQPPIAEQPPTQAGVPPESLQPPPAETQPPLAEQQPPSGEQPPPIEPPTSTPVAEQPAGEEAGVMDQVTQVVESVPGGWLTLGGLLALLLAAAGGGWYLKKRREQPIEEEEVEILEIGKEPVLEEVELTEEVSEANDGEHLLAQKPGTGSEEDAAAFETETFEAVQVYIDYEEFDRAHKTIDTALERYPDHHQYRLKRLEIDAAANDTEAFRAHARVLHDAVDGQGPLWEQAEALWEVLAPGRDLGIGQPAGGGAGAAGLAAGAAAAGAAAGAAEMDFDLGTEETGGMPVEVDLDALDNLDENDTSLDFDLGELGVETGGEEDGLDLSQAGGDEEDLSLDLSGLEESSSEEFDLDLGEEIPSEEEGSSLDMGGLEDAPAEEALGEELSFDMGLEEPTAGEDDLSLDMGGLEDSAGEDLSFDTGLEEPALGGEDDLSLDMGGLEDSAGEDLSFDTGLEEPAPGGEDEISLDMGGLEDSAGEDLSFDTGLEEPAPGGEDDLSFDMGGLEDISNAGDDLDMGLSDMGGESGDLNNLLGQLEEDSGGLPGGEEMEFSLGDEVSGKFDLAQMYLDMEDLDNARGTLEEILLEGDDEQKARAEAILAQIGATA